MSLNELAPVLQIALGPVILISGIGLLLLSMTNRFSRIIDRSRQLSAALRSATGSDRAVALSQIAILSRRARLVRRAIVLATVSILCAAILVITLFLLAVFRLDAVLVVVVLFGCCMAALCGALVAFLQDVNQSLAAVKLELEATHDGPLPAQSGGGGILPALKEE